MPDIVTPMAPLSTPEQGSGGGFAEFGLRARVRRKGCSAEMSECAISAMLRRGYGAAGRAVSAASLRLSVAEMDSSLADQPAVLGTGDTPHWMITASSVPSAPALLLVVAAAAWDEISSHVAAAKETEGSGAERFEDAVVLNRG